MYKRNQTRQVMVKDIQIGGNDTVTIQTMTTTKTKNVDETVKQINTLATAGAHIIRCAIFDMDDAKAIKHIKQQVTVPIVADIHFDYRLALEVLDNGIDKVRINPGNIGSEDRVRMVVEKCKEKGVPIRIGINGGSLEKEVIETHGVTAEGMIASLDKHIKILEDLDFYDIVISLKSSDIEKAVEAYRMAARKYPYPLHIGITESGTKFAGTIKSSLGIGMLLYEGIGNTIRVSLSTDPIEEVKVAKELLAMLGLYKKPKIISCPTCGRLQYDMFKILAEIEAYLETIDKDVTVAVMGCAVNGPGEAKAADIGIAGGKNSGLIFVNGEVKRKVPQDKMVEELIKEINDF